MNLTFGHHIEIVQQNNSPAGAWHKRRSTAHFFSSLGLQFAFLGRIQDAHLLTTFGFSPVTDARNIDPRIALERQAEEACAEIDAEIRSLEAKKTAIRNNVANFISSMDALGQLGIKVSPPQAIATVTPTKPVIEPKPTPIKDMMRKRTVTIRVGPRATATDTDGNRVSYTSEIMRVVKKNGGYATIPDIRDEVAKGPMAERLAVTDKGFYSGIEKLKSKHELIKHRGYLFTKAAKSKHDREVANGTKQELPEAINGNRKAPLADAIMTLVVESGDGILGKDVVAKLIENPEFTASISRNHTGAYNVLSRLKAQGRIEKLEDGRYAPIQKENDPAVQPGQKPEGSRVAAPQPSLFSAT